MASHYNLTETQRDLVRWVVEEARRGNLDEELFAFWWDREGIGLYGYEELPFKIRPHTVVAIIESGLFEGRYRQFRIGFWPFTSSMHGRICSLTRKAYEAVDSGFESEAPDVLEVIPLARVDHLDEELWERCRYSISAAQNDPKAWDKAVRTATTVLEERLRKFGRDDLKEIPSSAARLVNDIFGNSGPWQERIGGDEAGAYRDLYAGAIGVFRNRYAHRIVDPTPEEGGAIISFVDLLLKMLNDLQKKKERQ